MLLVIGNTDIAISVAAYAAAVSGREVALHRTSGRQTGGAYDVVLDAHRSQVSLHAGAPSGPVEAAVVVTEGPQLLDTLSAVRDLLPGVPTLLAPGNVAGAARARAAFDAWGLTPPALAETSGFPVVGAVTSSEVVVRAVKRSLPCGTPAGEADGLCDAFRTWLPELVPAASIEVSLANTNNVIHPPLVLANATTIDRGEPLRFYREGLSDAGCALVHQVDDERMAVTDALDLERVSITGWMLRFYGDQGMSGSSIRELLEGFAGFETSMAPIVLDYRYLNEDVAYGLAPLEAIAARLGVATPVTSALATLASSVLGRDLRSQASRLADLALEGAAATTAAP